jgi:hypothetical protein
MGIMASGGISSRVLTSRRPADGGVHAILSATPARVRREASTIPRKDNEARFGWIGLLGTNAGSMMLSRSPLSPASRVSASPAWLCFARSSRYSACRDSYSRARRRILALHLRRLADAALDVVQSRDKVRAATAEVLQLSVGGGDARDQLQVRRVVGLGRP